MTTFFKRVTQIFMFEFGRQVFPNEDFLHFLYFFDYCFENEAANIRDTILDSANTLKINIFPSSVIFLILHNFKIFCIFNVFQQFCFLFIIFDCEKKKFMVSGVKSTHLIQQTAILTSFQRTYACNIYGFNPDNFENDLKVFISSLIDF